MNQAHADMDEMGDWAEHHPITQRIHRATPLEARYPGETFDDDHPPAEAASSCTEIGADVPLTTKEAARFWSVALAPAIVFVGVVGFYIWARFGHVW